MIFEKEMCAFDIYHKEKSETRTISSQKIYNKNEKKKEHNSKKCFMVLHLFNEK